MDRYGKIGRNDPCPCGSGKKYKKCCLNKVNLKTKAWQYEKIDLLSKIASLQIYHPNASAIARLQNAIIQILSLDINEGKNIIQGSQLKQMLDSEYLPQSSILMSEDPQEELFTRNMGFNGGNYIVYPGIISEAVEILRDLLNCIFYFQSEFPKEFIQNVENTSRMLFDIVNLIASDLGHKRNIGITENWQKGIEIPGNKIFDKAAKALIFDDAMFEVVARCSEVKKELLEPFIADIRDIDFDKQNVFDNFMMRKPFIRIKDKCILLAPNEVLGALKKHILELTFRYSIQGKMADCYSKICWNQISYSLRKLSYEHLDLPEISTLDKPCYHEECFSFGKNKIAYVIHISDDLKGLEDIWKTDLVSKRIENRIKNFESRIKNKGISADDIFFMIVMSSLGRGGVFRLEGEFPGLHIMTITDWELATISDLDDMDDLTLWKYNEAIEQLQSNGRSINPPFLLDKFFTYMNHNYSFNVTGDSKPSVIIITPGDGGKLKEKAIIRKDAHLIFEPAISSYAEVVNRFADRDIPIFLKNEIITRPIELVVEVERLSIWIKPLKKRTEISEQFMRRYFDMTETMAYWIWQLWPQIDSYLKQIERKSIEIFYDFETVEVWNSLPEYCEKFELPFLSQGIVDGEKIIAIVKNKIRRLLIRDDNAGERVLVGDICKLINGYLSQNNLKIIPKREIKNIVDLVAPLGRKKKLIFAHRHSKISLSDEGLIGYRELQEHDAEYFLEDITDCLDEKLRNSNGRLLNNEEKNKLFHELVDIYYKRLLEFVSKFDKNSLLELALAYNEGVWNKREFIKITTPTATECFPNSTCLIELSKDAWKIDSTALALRTLIEMLSAQKYNEGKIPGLDDLDKVMALAHHVVNFGFFSDDIKNQIIDHQVKILGNKRIGIEPGPKEKLLNDFLENKMKETIKSSKETFYRYFEGTKDEKQEVDEIFNNAFMAEFSISIEEFTNLIIITRRLWEKEKPVYNKIELSEFRSVLKKMLKCTDDKVDNIINNFSLSERDGWENPPEGFSKNDIWPWIYGRRLSFMRKPFIIENIDGKLKFIIWGQRHLEESFRYTLYNILSGRLNSNFVNSEEMKSYIGGINKRQGDEFEKQVVKYFRGNISFLIDERVEIKPGKKLDAEKDLGDIDVLIISNKIIYQIECKNVNFGRNQREVANELKRFTTGDNWINKVKKRENWLKNNIEKIKKTYNLNDSSYIVKSVFVVSTEIPTKYLLEDESIPFITFDKIQSEGFNAIETVFKLDKS